MWPALGVAVVSLLVAWLADGEAGMHSWLANEDRVAGDDMEMEARNVLGAVPDYAQRDPEFAQELQTEGSDTLRAAHQAKLHAERNASGARIARFVRSAALFIAAVATTRFLWLVL